MPGAQTREMTVGGHRVILTWRRNAVRLNLRADEKRNVFALTAPVGAPMSRVQRFLDEHIDWMNRVAVERLSDFEPRYVPGERHLLQGRRVTLGEDGIPAGRAFLVLRQRTLEALIRELLPLWEGRMGVKAAVVRFRNMHSRWGSCQPQRAEIHLSALLGQVPRELTEYVLAHELCHLLYADHGPGFHAAMTRFLPDWEERRRALARFDRRPWPGTQEKEPGGSSGQAGRISAPESAQ